MATVRSNAADTNVAKLADHAATAALYATDPERRRAGDEVLESEYRNESAPLPAGLTLANASAAASIAQAKQKPVDTWKPERQPEAERAALLARGYQASEPSSVPKVNPDVYKAALSAAKERVSAASPPTVSNESRYDQSAASHIMSNGMRGARETTVVTINPGALTAASGAVFNRRRTESALTKPVFHPDAAYALTAAAISHRANRATDDVLDEIDPSLEAARIHHIAKSNVQLYTSTPPVEIEVEEQKHRDTLRAAAISMAKDMYATAAAKGEPDTAETAGSIAHARHSRRLSQSRFSWISGDEQTVTRRPLNIHEAAQKIASEKLAKMQQNDLANQQQYYGISGPRSRLTLTRRLRRRTSSDGDASQIDWERSEEIRHQMSSLQSRLHQLDEKKSKDRSDLMEIARKNVNARIHDMDERVYARTGKPSPNMQREWEEQAQERARAESDARMTNFGRISVGGQKYMDESEIEAIARARIEPTLNEISDRVEEKRAKEIEQRLDQERSQRLTELEHERKAELQREEKQRGTLDEERLNRRHSRKGSTGLLARTSRLFLGRKAPVEEDERQDVNGIQESEKKLATSAPDEQPVEQSKETDTVPMEEPERQEETPTADTTQPAQPPRDGGDGVAAVTGAAEPPVQNQSAVDGPEELPKSKSKIRYWFRAKFSRRASEPQLSEETGTGNEGRDTGSREASAVGATADSLRAAPLSSNPVTEEDIAPATSNVPSVDHEAIRQWSTSTAGSGHDENRRSSAPPEVDGKRRRLRMSLKDMISRKTSSETGASPLASPTTPTATATATENVGTTAMTRPSAARLNTMERIELRDNFTEDSLPLRPTLFSSSERRSISSSARDSRFSEDI